MTTLPQMGLVLPTRGAPGAGIWDDTADANYGLIDAHNHSTGQGTAVPTAGININADLTFSSLWAPTNLHRITFASIVALTGNNKSLFVSSADNELYWRSNTGTNVKLTSGSSLNVAAFAGGIGGDYASVGAAVAFDDANDRYTFKQNSPGFTWARLASGDVRLFETGTTESLFVGLAAPAALAGSYTITMPLAAPGSTQIVQMDSSGVLTASNTVANAVTFSGDIKHGDRTKLITALAAAGQSGATWTIGSSANAYFAISTAASSLVVPVEFIAGDRVKSISFKVFGDGAADLTTTVYSTDSAMTATSIGTASTSNQPASWSTVTIDVTDTTVASLGSITIEFSVTAASIRIGNISATYDRP